MSDQLPPDQNPGESPEKGGWRRPLSYLLLIIGAAGIVFNNQVSLSTGLPLPALQIGTFALFIIGAVLFFSVRETTDRVSSYREVFSSNKPADSSTDQSPIEPTANISHIEPASKDASPADPDEK